MSTIELKKHIKNYIDTADERMLRIFNAIIESESENDLVFRDHKEELDLRLHLHEENPTAGKEWSAVKDSLQKKYGI
ncbi:addiction module family protein [Sphingobacterium sp. DN00404]|uniref:Addiction module family protein n=1 Tax=Sphingobacterium micropteri TaxID=2763501 RepID=A0ABR7YRF4_9SPHI|nr:addiction module family protein [Sphingobacterium micropteri]MBD1433923.1 addiction module family protein [Sphingobacterium micropteri]